MELDCDVHIMEWLYSQRRLWVEQRCNIAQHKHDIKNVGLHSVTDTIINKRNVIMWYRIGLSVLYIFQSVIFQYAKFQSANFQSVIYKSVISSPANLSHPVYRPIHLCHRAYTSAIWRHCCSLSTIGLPILQLSVFKRWLSAVLVL